MNRLAEWLRALSPRERRMVIGGALVAGVLLLVAVLLPLDRSVAQARERIERKQNDLVWMRSVAAELAAAGAASPTPGTQESLIVVIDRAAREAGLGSALTSSEPSGERGLRVRLERAPFDALVGWLARLSEQHGIAVETATIDGAGQPGLVNAGFVLRAR